MRVKICGNRTLEEIRLAADAGADAVGLIVGARHLTEDNLEIDVAAELLAATPVFVNTVLVTHQVYADEIRDIFARVPTSTIQLHDDIPTEQIRLLRRHLGQIPFIKALHVEDEAALDAVAEFVPIVEALLLDSRTPDRIGGTGRVHDWSISAQIVARSKIPVILAGGLTPENVLEAVKQVRPYAVDVNSGVESADGSKAADKVWRFIRAAKTQDPRSRADTELHRTA